MFHPFENHEGHEPTRVQTLLALLLAIPYCLAWTIVLAVDRKQPSSPATPRREVLPGLVEKLKTDNSTS